MNLTESTIQKMALIWRDIGNMIALKYLMEVNNRLKE
jgi:hypothetical protein